MKTHWRKNNDKRYISGEDLQHGEVMQKGLKPSMIVEIIGFEDAPTFDQKLQSDITKTGLFLKEVGGAKLYKPVILNVSNGEFLQKEFGSEFLEDWMNKPFVLFAKPDKRHGFVARFKKHYQQAPSINPTSALNVLSQATTLADLATRWSSLTKAEQGLGVVQAKKDELKNILV